MERSHPGLLLSEGYQQDVVVQGPRERSSQWWPHRLPNDAAGARGNRSFLFRVTVPAPHPHALLFHS
jgi:hypothetical protein